jgi:hypothetical protein
MQVKVTRAMGRVQTVCAARIFIGTVVVWSTLGWARQAPAGTAAEAEELAKKLANPISDLVSVPSVVVLKQSGKMTYGTLWNQIWSFSGNSGRADVNQMFLQPFFACIARPDLPADHAPLRELSDTLCPPRQSHELRRPLRFDVPQVRDAASEADRRHV